MKTAYLGGTRGHQAAVYRPGTGWIGSDQGRHFGRQPRAFKSEGRLCVCPLTMVDRRRPGLRTKALVVLAVLVVTTLLAMVLNGGAQF
jgi:hypothetical protein